jgi:hypothetical protein
MQNDYDEGQAIPDFSPFRVHAVVCRRTGVESRSFRLQLLFLDKAHDIDVATRGHHCAIVRHFCFESSYMCAFRLLCSVVAFSFF